MHLLGGYHLSRLLVRCVCELSYLYLGFVSILAALLSISLRKQRGDVRYYHTSLREVIRNQERC